MESETVVEPESTALRTAVRDPSPIAAGLVVLAGLLLFFWVTGALFSGELGNYRMSSAQITGMALTYSVTPAFLIAALLHARRRTRRMLAELVASGSLDVDAARSVRDGGSVMGIPQNVALTLAGIILGSLQINGEQFLASLREPTMIMVVSIAAGNIITWITVVHVGAHRAITSIELLRLGRDRVEVDLLRLDALLPFGRIATLHVLIVAIAVSLSAFQSLDAELRWVNYSAAFAVGIPAGLTLLLLPMIGIRHNVHRVKARALEDVDEAIAHADRALEPEPLRYLGDLLQRRDALQQAREWPLDFSAFSRIAVYFVIPPIAWIGGAIAEILIESVL